jgi:CubicO group peptidase (beta-lactamase class C family)
MKPFALLARVVSLAAPGAHDVRLQPDDTGSHAAGSPTTGSRAAQAPPDLDAYVARVMQAFDVPGIALAVVKDGTTVVAKGYGVRRLGAPTPVDARTLFGIASNTKVFTATVRDLLVHRSGLGLPVLTPNR